MQSIWKIPLLYRFWYLKKEIGFLSLFLKKKDCLAHFLNLSHNAKWLLILFVCTFPGSYMVNWSPNLQTAVSDLVCAIFNFWVDIASAGSMYEFERTTSNLSSYDLFLGSRIFWRTWKSILYQVSCCWRFKVVFKSCLLIVCSTAFWHTVALCLFPSDLFFSVFGMLSKNIYFFFLL